MQRRRAAGLTQDALAEQVGLSKNHISNIERGKNLPTTKFLLRISSVLGETPDYYLMGKTSQETDGITSLVKRLPPLHQRALRRMLEVYLDEVGGF